MLDTMITASFSGRFFMHMGGRHEWAFHIVMAPSHTLKLL